MLKVGDIVVWAQPDIDDVLSYGIVEYIKGIVFTVVWFDDGSSNDYSYHELRKVS